MGTTTTTVTYEGMELVILNALFQIGKWYVKYARQIGKCYAATGTSQHSGTRQKNYRRKALCGKGVHWFRSLAVSTTKCWCYLVLWSYYYWRSDRSRLAVATHVPAAV